MRFASWRALAFAFVACTKTGGEVAAGRHSWTKPGVLRVAVQSDLKNLNPLLNSNTTDVFVDRLMFEPLLSADPKGNPVPMLAAVVPTLENGGISRDGLTDHLSFAARHSLDRRRAVDVARRQVVVAGDHEPG